MEKIQIPITNIFLICWKLAKRSIKEKFILWSWIIKKHYQYGGLNGLEFRGYNGDAIADENPAYKVVIAQVDNNNNPPWMTFNSGDHYIGGNYYDGK